ncbi:hypothetical protein EDF62_1572 [Leucobacter luti]|uniref:Uncharacterized protein n=1 Tax=Leucobacter luti TaxID=340320 RepID=A0A4R6S161_9MICO|nr:hypothetical protein EDF62_1572 [Leucobacter luti]
MSRHVPGTHVRPVPHLVRRAGPAHEPGTVRRIEYGRCGPDGKCPVVHWPSVAVQVAEATEAISRELSAARHTSMQLYSMSEHCGHTNPEDDEKYDGVDDLIDDWLQRNCMMEPGWPAWEGSLSTLGAARYAIQNARGRLRSRNYDRAVAVIPLANEWRRAQDWYDDNHSWNVCLASPQGTACAGCLDDEDVDPDYGIESGACSRAELAFERRNEFWDRFTEDSLRLMAKLHAELPERDSDWVGDVRDLADRRNDEFVATEASAG